MNKAPFWYVVKSGNRYVWLDCGTVGATPRQCDAEPFLSYRAAKERRDAFTDCRIVKVWARGITPAQRTLIRFLVRTLPTLTPTDDAKILAVLMRKGSGR